MYVSLVISIEQIQNLVCTLGQVARTRNGGVIKNTVESRVKAPPGFTPLPPECKPIHLPTKILFVPDISPPVYKPIYSNCSVVVVLVAEVFCRCF